MAQAPLVKRAGADVALNMAPSLSAFGDNPGVVGAGGAAAVATFDADSGRRNTIKQVHWSFSAAPAAGVYVQVEDGSGTVVWKMFVAAVAGHGSYSFDRPPSGSVNTAMIVTLSAPGGAVVGTLWADVYREE